MSKGIPWMGRAYKSIYDEFILHDVTYRKILEDRRLLDGVSSVFSIGAGEGKLEVEVARDYGVHLGYLDRAESVFQAFNLRAEEAQISSLITERFLGSFEDYVPKRQYDLVLAIHSWYSVWTNRQILEKALRLVGPGGRLLVALTSQEDQFKHQIWLEPLWAEAFSAWAHSEGFAHEFFTHSVNLSVGIFLRNGELTEGVQTYVGFLNQVNWKDLPAPIRDRARAFLMDRQSAGTIGKVDGCLVFEDAS